MLEFKQQYQWKDHPQAFISIMGIKEDYVNVYNFQIPSTIGPSVSQWKILELEEFINNGKLIRRKKMSKQSLYEQMKTLWEDFDNEHNGTTKASQQRARKAIGELKKLVTDYRKASVEETK